MLFLIRKLLRKNNWLQNCQVYMSDLIANCYAKLTTEDGSLGKASYIQHYGIYYPEKPGKLRVVFDCSDSHKGMCLNDNLLQDLNITNNLVGVLLSFRQESIAVEGDIQLKFLFKTRLLLIFVVEGWRFENFSPDIQNDCSYF